MLDSIKAKLNVFFHGEHPCFPRAEWEEERRLKETRLSYWRWVKVQLASLGE